MTGFTLGVLVGPFFGNLLLQVYGTARAEARFRPNLDLGHPGFKLFLKLAVPIGLALSLTLRTTGSSDGLRPTCSRRPSPGCSTARS